MTLCMTFECIPIKKKKEKRKRRKKKKSALKI